jgi:Flp pilus assembly protein TadB
MTRLRFVVCVFLVACALQLAAPITAAQPDLEQERPSRRGDVVADTPDTFTQLAQLRHAIVRLPVAAALASVLALRPRRRGTPKRQAPVIQTQIILAVVGAVVMLVVGSSLARAFGIVGAAGLVRYRAKIEDPKDAGVMLSTLAIGLASGVGLWMLAAFATVFILGVPWVVESFEPKATQLFTLKVTTADPVKLKPLVEQLLARFRVPFELRAAAKGELQYEVRWPVDRRTDRISEAILELDRHGDVAVDWEEKKEKK